MDLKIKLFKQLVRFGLVGLSAAATQISIVVALVESGIVKQPLLANIVGFLFAFQVSYFGHRRWTFNETLTQHRVAVPRLLIVSISAFIANESLFFVFMNTFHLPYPLALFCVLAILPIVTFTLSKLWVFR